jgi:hypothetical protein
MSTHSRIGRVLPNGGIESIYCHFDGYPAGVGKMLVENYNTPEKVEALIALGGISSLAETLEETKAYARDMGESIADNKAEIRESAYSYLCMTRKDGGHWAYLFKDGKWTFAKVWESARDWYHVTFHELATEHCVEEVR